MLLYAMVCYEKKKSKGILWDFNAIEWYSNAMIGYLNGMLYYNKFSIGYKLNFCIINFDNTINYYMIEYFIRLCKR